MAKKIQDRQKQPASRRGDAVRAATRPSSKRSSDRRPAHPNSGWPPSRRSPASPATPVATRLRNRDAVDGRPRGHLRKFGLSRVRMRELAHQGQLPGIRKASW